MIIACNCLNTFLSFNINQDQDSADSIPLPSALSMPISCERYHKNTTFSKQLVDFRNNSKVQAIIDLQVNISQKDLILTIPIMNWELNYCINCNKITHAVERKEQTSSNVIIINSSLQRKYEDIIASKSEPTFSSAFGIIMMNQQQRKQQQQQQQSQPQNTSNRSDPEFRIRLKNLEKTLRQRIQSEIVATDERIKRHTEQEFALLKNFSDKSDSEYQNLVSLVQNVPENLFEMQFYNEEDHDDSNDQQNPTSNDVSDTSAINNTSTNTQQQQQQQQITSFDTPPATPESTPMSVGNSPIFRQQQLPQSAANNNCNGLRGPFSAVNNGAVHKNTSIINNNNLDDCIFELEGLEAYPTSVGVMSNSSNGNNMSDDEYNNETEDAQDALGELDPIPSYGRPFTVPSSLNAAKSVPIGIAQSFEDDQKQISCSRRNNFDSDDEVLDNNIDIAASIKAIARSVHGDKVFGDLPRPRFSYKI